MTNQQHDQDHVCPLEYFDADLYMTLYTNLSQHDTTHQADAPLNISNTPPILLTQGSSRP